MKCKDHLEDGGCRQGFPHGICEGEDNCLSYREDAKRTCPSCGCLGANWSGWDRHCGDKYICWTCKNIWVEAPTRHEPSPGKCLRCGRSFENPVPEITNPGGNTEIATDEYCADCNRLVMSLVNRYSSAYWKKGELSDPLRKWRGRELEANR